MTTAPPRSWIKDARTVRMLSWFSLIWMVLEGALGLVAGGTAGPVFLIGWALSSAVERLASIIVIWRFTGSRTLSETAEGRAQKAVAVSFWLLAPYIGIQSLIDLATGHRAENSVLGIVLTAASLVIMPVIGVAKQRLGARLNSGATAGEGTQNLLCAATAAAVLIGLAGNALFGAWWLDPVIGLIIAAVAVKEGREAWKGEDCC